jgi:hypothetical protein
MLQKVRRVLSPRKRGDSSPREPISPRVDSSTLSPPTSPEQEEYKPIVERKLLSRGYDSVVLRQAETFLFDRNQSTPEIKPQHKRKSSSMVEETLSDKRLEQAYMEYISDAIIQNVDVTDDSTDEASEKSEKVKKKQLGAAPANPNQEQIELYRSLTSLFIYDGDKDKLEENIKTMQSKGKIKEAANALVVVADVMIEQKDYRSAMKFYERSCDLYERAKAPEKALHIRSNLMPIPMMNLELYEVLAENYESITDQVPNKWVFQCFSILLRLCAFLKGDGSEGSYELQERLDSSEVSVNNQDLQGQLSQIFQLIGEGNRQDAEKIFKEMEMVTFNDEIEQEKFDSIRAMCAKYCPE